MSRHGNTPEIAHWRIDGCVGAVVRCMVLDPVGPGGQAVSHRYRHASSSWKPCGLTQQIAVQLLMQSVKQQQSFLHFEFIQIAQRYSTTAVVC